jgi:hypothetical protein
MKKLIFIAVFAIFSISAFAQSGSGVKLPLAVGDTILNTTTVSKVISTTGGYSGASVQVILTSQSGTPAGSVKLYGSTDNGTTYDQIAASSADTLAIGASALHYTWRVASPLPAKLKVVAKGTGSQHTLVTVWYRLPVYQNR